MKKLADDQCSSITKGSIYHIKHMYTQPFTTVVDWPEIWWLMEVSTMFYIWRYGTVFLLGVVEIMCCVKWTFTLTHFQLVNFNSNGNIIIGLSPGAFLSVAEFKNTLSRFDKLTCFTEWTLPLWWTSTSCVSSLDITCSLILTNIVNTISTQLCKQLNIW